MSSRTLRITLLASEWKSSKGGLSTMNRELAIQLAKHPNVSVSFLVPKCSDEDKREASSHNVKILEAKERPGFEPNVWLAFPPKDLVIDFVVGHGAILGKQAQIIRDSHHCQWVQVIHTAPYELAMYKTYYGAISKGNEKQRTELKLCKMADLVIAVGPKLVEFYAAHLSSCGKKVYNFTPGIFTEFSCLKLSSQSGKFRLLVFGRGDSEDFELKGYDIAAQAVAKLNDKSFYLTFVGAPSGSEDQVTEELLKQGLDRSQLIVEGYLEDREYLVTLLCASNLVIVPSRTEGFGLTALEALSAGLPFLVSQNSGFGEAVKEISLGSTFVVDSEDPEQWAEAIKRVRQKGCETAIQECQDLRERYAEKYSWNRQTRELLSIMLSSFNGEEEMSEYPPPKQTLSQKGVTPPPVRVVEPVVPLRLLTSLPERPTARERVQSPSVYAPGETMAPHIRDQGARPKEQSSSNTESSTLELKDLSIVGELSQQRRGESGLQRWDTLRLEDKPKTRHSYPIATAGHATKEQAALYTKKEDNFQRRDPLQCDTSGFEEKPNTTFPSTTCRENATLSTERAGRLPETAPSQLKIKERKDLSVVGWNAKRKSLSAVTQLIQKQRDILNLSCDPDVLNLAVNDMISYLENNPLKYCVLVIDAEKVKAARDQELGVNYLRLLQTAERNIAEKTIITVCCPKPPSINDERIVNRTIAEAFNDNSKVYIFWFVNGKLALNPDDFVMVLTSNITKPCSKQRTFAAQTPCFENIQLDSSQENVASGSSPYLGYNPHGIDLRNCKIFLPTGKTVMVLTRLRNGIISRRPEDVEYWMSDFDVPVKVAHDLMNKNSKKSNVELVILLNEKGVYTSQVDKKRGKEWQQWIVLALDETVVLQTRLKHGQISFQDKDVVIHYQNWQVPQDEIHRLMRNYEAIPDADLFVVSDSKENVKMIVQERPRRNVLGKKKEMSKYQSPKKPALGHITPPPIRPSEPEAFSRLYSFPEEKPYTGERVQSTKPDAPMESRAHRISDQGARPKEKRSSSIEIKDLVILGCCVSNGSIHAVTRQIEHILPELNLQPELNPPVENLFPAKIKQYLERNWLKFCVLVVEAESVQDAFENLPKRRHEYEDLLKTAVDRVAEKVIIVVCDSLPLTQQDKQIVYRTIYRIIKEGGKGLIAWLKNGKLTVDPGVPAQFLLSSKPQSSRPKGSLGATNVLSFSATELRQTCMGQPRGRVNPLERETRYRLEKQNTQQPQGAIQRIQSNSHSNTTYNRHNPSTNELLDKSKDFAMVGNLMKKKTSK